MIPISEGGDFFSWLFVNFFLIKHDFIYLFEYIGLLRKSKYWQYWCDDAFEEDRYVEDICWIQWKIDFPRKTAKY